VTTPQDDWNAARSIGLSELYTQDSQPESLESLTPTQRELAHRIAQRRVAFQLLFELEAQQPTSPGSFVLDALNALPGIGPLAMQHVQDLVLSAWDKRSSADQRFTTFAPEWPTHRLAGVDRAILRLAHAELTAKSTAPAIIINECVELARAFSTDRSPSFVNALLDRAAKELGAQPQA
jgi:N utilization substance protein B